MLSKGFNFLSAQAHPRSLPLSGMLKILQVIRNSDGVILQDTIVRSLPACWKRDSLLACGVQASAADPGIFR